MRASQLADRLGPAAHRCIRIDAGDVAMLCEYAITAAKLLREKADVLDSYDSDYVRRTLVRMANECPGGQKEVARALDVSTGYVNDVIHERRIPGDKILEALGLQRVVTYCDRAP